MTTNLIFPAPFNNKTGTVEEMNGYIFSEIANQTACAAFGNYIDTNQFPRNQLAEEIRAIVKKKRPEWIIAANESATACLGLHRQRKILINPELETCHLNNVPEFARVHTWMFFSLPFEQSYECANTVYSNLAFIGGIPNLHLAGLKEQISVIITAETQ